MMFNAKVTVRLKKGLYVARDYLNKIKNDLGLANKIFEFLIFDPIDAEIETGFDGLFIDDEFLNIVSMGYEIKDCAYLCKYLNYNELNYRTPL